VEVVEDGGTAYSITLFDSVISLSTQEFIIPTSAVIAEAAGLESVIFVIPNLFADGSAAPNR
jgi:hypothetical protein